MSDEEDQIELFPRTDDFARSSTGKVSASRARILRSLKLKTSLLSSEAGSFEEQREVVFYASEDVLVEFKFLDPDKVGERNLTIRSENLAFRLRHVGTASLHTLQCKAFMKKSDYILLAFELPASKIPIAITTSSDRAYLTLSDVSVQEDYLPDIDTCLSWALMLAETVLQLAGFIRVLLQPTSSS